MNSSALPVRIDNVSAESLTLDTWLAYSVTNTSKEHVNTIECRIFVIDSRGKLVDTKRSGTWIEIAPGRTASGHADLKETVKSKYQLVIAVNKVITNAGVWHFDNSLLETLVKKQLYPQADTGLAATFEPNAIVTPHDRAEIFKLIMSDFINDPEKIKRLDGQADLIMLRSSIDFSLPDFSDKKLLLRSKAEIQDIADREQRTVYMIYEPLEAQGAKVFATIAIRDTLTRKRGWSVPYRFTFTFTCVKRDDRWVIEDSRGYA